jgi:hypothetical protein
MREGEKGRERKSGCSLAVRMGVCVFNEVILAVVVMVVSCGRDRARGGWRASDGVYTGS